MICGLGLHVIGFELVYVLLSKILPTRPSISRSPWLSFRPFLVYTKLRITGQCFISLAGATRMIPLEGVWESPALETAI